MLSPILPAAASWAPLAGDGPSPPAALHAAAANPAFPGSPLGAFQPAASEPGKLRETFDQFVGETFFGTLLKSMRRTVDKPAYFHGGRAEEVFQGQLDQQMVEHVSRASADQFSGPLFELFQLQRR